MPSTKDPPPPPLPKREPHLAATPRGNPHTIEATSHHLGSLDRTEPMDEMGMDSVGEISDGKNLSETHVNKQDSNQIVVPDLSFGKLRFL